MVTLIRIKRTRYSLTGKRCIAMQKLSLCIFFIYSANYLLAQDTAAKAITDPAPISYYQHHLAWIIAIVLLVLLFIWNEWKRYKRRKIKNSLSEI